MLEKITSWVLSRNQATAIDTEQLTVLELTGRTAQKTNEVVEALNTLEAKQEDDVTRVEGKQSTDKDYLQGEINKKVSISDLENNRKLDSNGDFKGTWHGLNPAMADPGISGLVQSHDDNFEKLHMLLYRQDMFTPKRSLLGGQLVKLKQALADPLQQIVGIVFIGDSITWGKTATGGATSEPRDGTLSDPRDNYDSKSFVNEVKRYLGKMYGKDSVAVQSNPIASPSGQAITEFTVQNILYPRDGDFSLTKNGTSLTDSDVQVPSSLTGFQLKLVDGNVAGTSYQSVKFKFTGDSFTLAFSTVEASASFYDLYVDGVKQGTYTTHVGNGILEGYNNQRIHTFPYVRDKEIEIRTNRNGEATGNRDLRIEAIIVNKKIRITNNGINGATTNTYKVYNLAGNTFNDGVAINVSDNFCFVQLGTNDRISRSDTPKGVNKFKVNYKLMLDKITPYADTILMCANPVSIANEQLSTVNFSMQQVRDTVYRIAKELSLDFIDNYSIFNGLDITQFTVDGTHPNDNGHNLIARNIINSIEL